MAIKVPRKKMTFAERIYLPAIGKGMVLTIKHFIKAPVGGTVTIRYPEKRRPIAEGFRGLHHLKPRDTGDEKCVACEMCAKVCPAGAITILAEESADPAVEKRPAVYEIDLLRCIFCGMCVEACPRDALDMTKLYELANDKRDKFLVRKDVLLATKKLEKEKEN